MRNVRRNWRRLSRVAAGMMPTGLFGRSLIIIIAPMILLQTVMTFVFMERHWESVTNRLSTAVVRDISALVEVIEAYPQDSEFETVRDIMVMFANNVGEVVPRLDLVGDDATANERTVDVQINRLRRKIENDPANPTWLQTVRGIGYKLHVE